MVSKLKRYIKDNGGNNMKKRQTIKAKMIPGLIALAVMFVIFPFQAGATDCSTLLAQPNGDPDNDGFTNSQECQGLTYVPNNVFLNYPSCRQISPPPRGACIDPESSDLFVILFKQTPTNVPPTNPLEFVTTPATSGGLGIYIHEIDFEVADIERRVTNVQHAVRITEDTTNDNSNVLGNTPYGTPNASGCGDGVVYTQRVINQINMRCAGKTECKDVYTGINYSCPSSCSGLYQRYIKATYSHEIAHSVNLRNPVDPTNGIHYPTKTTTTIGSQTHHLVLGANWYYTDKGGKVAWYIGDAFTDPDRQGKLLR
jgi:hypothetical protein